MSRSIRGIPPLELIDAYEEHGHRVKDLFAAYGDKTVARLIDGASTLASLWRSAWELGNGSAIPDGQLRAVPEAVLSKLYLDKAWAASVRIAYMARDGDKLTITAPAPR